MIKISIIIPVYNTEKYLKKCLDSIINQTLKSLEIICIDDCSTDNCLHILKEYQLKDNRIKIIEQKENKGQGVARNLGLNIAEGEYIMFLDPDDWLELNACEIAYNQISKNKNDIVFFGTTTHIEKQNKKFNNDIRLQPFLNYFNKANVKLYEIDVPFIKTFEIWYKIYNHSFIKQNQIKFSTERFGEEGDFSLKAIVLSDTASFIDKHLYNYRIRTSSVTTQIYAKRYMEYIAAREKNYYDLQRLPNGNKYINAFLVYYINSLEYWYKRIEATNIIKKIKYYSAMRKIFIRLNKENDIKSICAFIDYGFFNKTINRNAILFIVILCLKNILSFKISGHHFILSVLGIKIKIKKEQQTRFKNG